MANEAPFDYEGRAQAAREAKLAFDNYTAEMHGKLHETPRNREIWAEWHKLQASSAYQRLLDAYWAALEAAYPPDFDDDFDQLRHHMDMKALETAIAFLEADLYFFRTGYIKGKMLKYIRGYQLSAEHVMRLQHVILNKVDSHYCREFREYCRLARRIDNGELRQQLQNRAISNDANIRKRAQWVLDYLNR